MNRWPNYCPFCGTHSRLGGTGNRHGTFNCMKCHSDYNVEYFRAYPPDRQSECDEQFVQHGGVLVKHEDASNTESLS
jgi:transposase-like protein